MKWPVTYFNQNWFSSSLFLATKTGVMAATTAKVFTAYLATIRYRHKIKSRKISDDSSIQAGARSTSKSSTSLPPWWINFSRTSSWHKNCLCMCKIQQTCLANTFEGSKLRFVMVATNFGRTVIIILSTTPWRYKSPFQLQICRILSLQKNKGEQICHKVVVFCPSELVCNDTCNVVIANLCFEWQTCIHLVPTGQPSLLTPFYSVLMSVSVFMTFQLYFIP